MTESRRRRGGLELNDSERIAIGNALSGANKKFRPMQRKLRRWEHHDLSLLFFLFLCLGLVILVYAIRYRYQEASKYPSLAGVSHEFRKSYQDSRQRVLPAYKDLYDKIYMLATERLQPPDETLWPEYERYSYEIKATYGATVQQCPITIVVLDTKLGKPVYDYGPGQFLWFELESIGAFAPDACIVLQTSKSSTILP